MKKNIKDQLATLFKKPEYQDHKAPVTRRDFVKLGLLAGGGLMTSPLWSKIAKAEGNSFPAFMVFDLAGGASLPGNFLVGHKGGSEDLLDNYKSHGWNPRASGALDKTFGIPMAANASLMLQGLKDTLPEDLKRSDQVNFKMGSFCHFSLDDTSSNKLSALSLISKAGLIGSVSKGGIGDRATQSGGNSDTALNDSQFKPKTVTSLNDIENLTSIGRVYDSLNSSSKRNLMKLVMSGAGTDEAFAATISKIETLGQRHSKGNPRLDNVASRILDLDQAENAQLHSAITHNVINQYVGPGVITIEGCDYHDGASVQRGQRKDIEIGRKIGQAVHLAHMLRKPFFFQVITDGGVYAPESDSYVRQWDGDSNQRSLTIIGYYDPNRRVEQRRTQVGHYEKGGVVDISTEIGKSPERMILGVLANYLNVMGRVGDLEKVLGVRMSVNEIDELLIFG